MAIQAAVSFFVSAQRKIGLLRMHISYEHKLGKNVLSFVLCSLSKFPTAYLYSVPPRRNILMTLTVPL